MNNDIEFNDEQTEQTPQNSSVTFNQHNNTTQQVIFHNAQELDLRLIAYLPDHLQREALMMAKKEQAKRHLLAEREQSNSHERASKHDEYMTAYEIKLLDVTSKSDVLGKKLGAAITITLATPCILAACFFLYEGKYVPFSVLTCVFTLILGILRYITRNPHAGDSLDQKKNPDKEIIEQSKE